MLLRFPKIQPRKPALTPEQRHALAVAPLPTFNVFAQAKGASYGPKSGQGVTVGDRVHRESRENW